MKQKILFKYIISSINIGSLQQSCSYTRQNQFIIYTDTNYDALCSYLCNTLHYVKCGSLVDALPCSSIKTLSFEHKSRSYERKYRVNVREVDNSAALYSRSYFYGRSKNYRSRIHAISIFMNIQKLWQIVVVSIACVKIWQLPT